MRMPGACMQFNVQVVIENPGKVMINLKVYRYSSKLEAFVCSLIGKSPCGSSKHRDKRIRVLFLGEVIIQPFIH